METWLILFVECVLQSEQHFDRNKLGRHSVHSVRILTSLHILVRVTFVTKHIQVSHAVHLQDVQSF